MNLPKWVSKMNYDEFCTLWPSNMAMDNPADDFPMNISISGASPAMFDYQRVAPLGPCRGPELWQVAKQLPGLKLPNTLMFDYPSPQVHRFWSGYCATSIKWQPLSKTRLGWAEKTWENQGIYCKRCMNTYIHTYIHTIPYHTIPYHTIPYHTIHYIHELMCVVLLKAAGASTRLAASAIAASGATLAHCLLDHSECLLARGMLKPTISVCLPVSMWICKCVCM